MFLVIFDLTIQYHIKYCDRQNTRRGDSTNPAWNFIIWASKLMDRSMGVKKSIDFAAWMPAFKYHSCKYGNLVCEGISVSQIAQRLPSAYNMSKGEKPDEKR